MLAQAPAAATTLHELEDNVAAPYKEVLNIPHRATAVHPHQRCGYSDSPFARIYFSILQGPEMG